MTKNVPAINAPALGDDSEISRSLIKALAMAVGKNTVDYVEVMYPEAIKHASSTFKLSLRNHIYNDIMHVATLHTKADIEKWLADNAAHHKRWLAMWRKIRRTKTATTGADSTGGEQKEKGQEKTSLTPQGEMG